MTFLVFLPILGLGLLGLHAVSRGHLVDALLAIGIRLAAAVVLNTVTVVLLVQVLFNGRFPSHSTFFAVAVGLVSAMFVIAAVGLGIRSVRREHSPTGPSGAWEAKVQDLEQLARDRGLFAHPLAAPAPAHVAPHHTMPTTSEPAAIRPPASTGRAHRKALADRISVLSQAEIDARLDKLGYVGQHAARGILGTAARLHLHHARELLSGRASASDDAGRDHVLVIGPTGSGKTRLVELLFREVLKVPTVLINTAQFTAAGYVGEKVSAILTRLVEAADGDAEWASCGVVCLDEFDKLAGDKRWGFSGDVGGYGVQRELLHLLSGTTAEYQPSLARDPNAAPAKMPLAGITFIACGAFSRLDCSEGVPEVSEFEDYGIMPELVGRFTGGTALLKPLGEEELMAILERRVLPEAERKARLLGESLRLGAAEKRAIVQRAFRRGTGARGLFGEVQRCVG